MASEYGFNLEETEYIARAASALYKLTRIHLIQKERFDEFMRHIYKVPGTNKKVIKKFARIGEAWCTDTWTCKLHIASLI